MINTLHIKNIGIIDDISINLNEGFNVITGETGAGKTLIIGSLQILAGGRFSKEMIRHGEKSCFVEASFSLEGYNFEDDMAVVSREINSSGKNTCKINGRLVTVTELKSFMSKVIDIHGQNENQSIMDTQTHIELVDEYANRDLKKLKNEYKKKYNEFLKINEELEKNHGDDREKQRTLDLLNYQVNEIEEANLIDGEEDELESKKNMMLSSEKICTSLNFASNEINENIIDSMNNSIRAIEKIESYNPDFSEIINRLKSCYYEIQETGRDLDNFSEDIYFDEEELSKIEERLELIKSLKRKYGNTIKEILEYKEKINQEIYEIENLDDYINELKENKKILENEMYEISLNLYEIRKEYAEKLSSKINKELKELEMKNSKFSAEIILLEKGKFNKNGLNKVEFKISTNVGEEAKSLVKIASGGEMSRIMLAIKSVLAGIDKTPIIIFDEIDTGISGVAANATGEKMKKISKNHQVICVTHLASIAAKGDFNYFVCKEVKNEKTATKVKLLNEKEVLEEIARISTGKITEISINQAKELRKNHSKMRIA